jgi:long-chain acyl-CoA synthetase
VSTIHGMFIDVARKHPASEAFTFRANGGTGAWTSLSYGESLARIRDIGAGLIDLGVTPGQHVSILANTRIEWTLCDYAVLGAGATVVPIYQTNSAAECEYILDNCGAPVLILEDASQLAKIDEVRSDLPALQHIVVMDPAGIEHRVGSDGIVSLDELEQRGAKLDDSSWDAAGAKVTDDTVASIIYTSGTTGPPKGCMLTHANIDAVIENVASVGEQLIRTGDRVMLFLPLAHTLAHSVQLAVNRLQGTVAYSTIGTLMEDMPHVHPTVLPSVPRVFEKAHARIAGQFSAATGFKKSLINWAMKVGRKRNHYVWVLNRATPLLLRPQYALAYRLVFSKIHARFGGKLRICVSGAAPLAREVQEFFLSCGIPILEGYGLTEGMPLTVNLPGRFHPGSVGPALGDTKLKIADDGEILAWSKMVFSGYYQNPDATAETRTEDGWLNTGDIGTIDRKGFLYITDRKKDLIITAGGKNVAPQNIENHLKTGPLISQALVYGDRKPFLTALLTLDAEDLAAWAKDNGAGNDLYALVADERVIKLVKDAVEHANSDLGRVEQVKRFSILPIDFTQETGELTPTLKLKRKVVVERYGKWIEHMYEGDCPDCVSVTDHEIGEVQRAAAEAAAAHPAKGSQETAPA